MDCQNIKELKGHEFPFVYVFVYVFVYKTLSSQDLASIVAFETNKRFHQIILFCNNTNITSTPRLIDFSLSYLD